MIEKLRYITLIFITCYLPICASEKPFLIKIKNTINGDVVFCLNEIDKKNYEINLSAENDSDQFDILINDKKINVKKIEQRYQTNLVIREEGSAFELTKWRHFFSKWVEIDNYKNNVFRSILINENDRLVFQKLQLTMLLNI